MKSVQRKICLFGMVLLMFSIPFIFASCGQETKSSVNLKFDPETVPTINTDSVTMLISDSGMIRYKVITKTWEIFDQAKDPYSYFPDKVYLEQFDTSFHVVVTVKADTAWNFSRRKLWRLKGNVFVRNILNETFSSDELYWDQQKEKIYSDKFVEINRPEKGMLRGKGGFEANQQMTEYEFKDVGDTPAGKTVIYVNENKEGEEAGKEKKE
ncbi:LPS export ABC transporter periplasmic protein LptC [Dysgonomonas sp. BGC7]|uniref:LPS export ABC transporter periplasmic protein LptC n=1 Tax=Dysgonomonas sp. BGC7 TaxID=1658008 RepID=UPI0006825E06|nr:LPS export ABC transporter periplasmic protein LptC [Dysgonomonas sp. BGC7]MBD8389044.1 LPS export ABC transporter periplasmic protein LptC [Dysgonomonas sp. BGC7]